MFNFKHLLTIGLLVTSFVAEAQNIGRTATPNEMKAWDIDVRPDFKGLPKGAGSVALGEKVWEAQCASCHGTFGESNSVFFQLIGYTSKKDVERGNVATLQLGNDAPARTMSMKLPTISTLWDYINRAMPWTAPKSLTADEVYGLSLIHI
jgi:cytochrome c